MNTFKKIGYTLLIGGSLLSSGCEKYFEGVNDDPNRPTDVSSDLLLPSAQAFLAYGNGGDLARYTSLFMQHITGTDRQFLNYQVYDVGESDMDNWWRFNIYGGALYDLQDIMKQSEEDGTPQYAGIAKILTAYGLMSATDVLGDIPYSDAFGASEGNTKPTYDSQETIYTTIQTLLAEAVADLSEPAAPIVPGSDDLIYGGDADLWIKTANVLSARAHIHLAKRDPSHYGMALTALGTEGVNSYGSNADDAFFTFGVDPTSASPWNQYTEQRGDIDYDGTLFNMMVSTGDPRLPVYRTDPDNLGSFFSASDARFYYVSYVEQKFIEAEAAFQTGDAARAASAHNAAVMASLSRFGVSDGTFENDHANFNAGNITLQEIMEQKYVAMFLDPESFSDWRRTGFPALTAVAGNVTSGVVPRRLPYPQSERIYNGANVPSVPSITNRVWWDVP